MTNLSALIIVMCHDLGEENHDVVTTCVKMSAGRNGTISMLAALILSLMFFAGFFLGYAARAWRSHKRRAHYLMHAPSRSKPPATTFGHARRAF
jgi:hypothetical protein